MKFVAETLFASIAAVAATEVRSCMTLSGLERSGTVRNANTVQLTHREILYLLIIHTFLISLSLKCLPRCAV